MSEKIIDYVKDTLKLKALDEKDLQGTIELNHYVDEIIDENKNLGDCVKNELEEYYHYIARMYYDKGFKDGKGLVKECLSD